MMLAVGLMIAAIFNLALTLLAFRWLLKPALTLLILAAAGTTYFMTQYGVLMDVGMLRNVMQTNPAEVADLLSPKLAVVAEDPGNVRRRHRLVRPTADPGIQGIAQACVLEHLEQPAESAQ